MDSVEAASLYIGLNLALLLALSLVVVAGRRRHQVTLGDGEVPGLRQAVRAHANAAEYIPAVLIGLVALALVGAQTWAIHVGGALLTIGRLAHAQGLLQTEGVSLGRAVGMVSTWASLAWVAGACVMSAF
jgi:uncharacterized protein